MTLTGLSNNHAMTFIYSATHAGPDDQIRLVHHLGGRNPNRGPSDPVATSSTIQTRLTLNPVQNPDPLNPPEEPPSEPSPTIPLQSMPEPWRLSGEEAMKLSPAVEYALASGWTSQSLKAHLSRRPDGGRYPAAVLARRLAELPTPPSTSLRRKTPWCGECEDEQSRTITVTPPDGVDDGRNLGRGRRGCFQRSAWFSTVVNRWN